MTQEDQGQTQQSRKNEHLIGLEQRSAVKQESVASDHKGAQEAEVQERCDVGGHGQEEHQRACHPGRGAEAIQHRGDEQYSSVTQGEEPNPRGVDELATGNGEQKQRDRGQGDDEPPLSARHRVELVLDRIERQKHAMEKDKVDSGAAGPGDAKRPHSSDPFDALPLSTPYRTCRHRHS